MGFQLVYWHYLKSINHPVLRFLDASPQSFVGEDIEISLMLLSYFTATTNMTRQTRVVGNAYQSLGLLSRIAKNVRDYKITRFGGATKSRTAVRYDEKTPVWSKPQRLCANGSKTLKREGCCGTRGVRSLPRSRMRCTTPSFVGLAMMIKCLKSAMMIKLT